MTDQESVSPISEGGPAPGFVLPDHDGSPVEVPVKGRPNVLIFYRGDW